MIQFMTLAHACAQAYWRQEINPQGQPPTNYKIRPYFIKDPRDFMQNQSEFQAVTTGTTYEQGLSFYNNGDIVIRFGERNEREFDRKTGNVHPTCGDIRIQTTSISSQGQGAGGPAQIQEYYFELIKQLWFSDTEARSLGQDYANHVSTVITGGGTGADLTAPAGQRKQALIDRYQGELDSEVTDAWEQYRQNTIDRRFTQQILERGWGGAGIWYNAIAQINGGFIGAVNNTPTVGPKGLPAIMVEVRNRKSEQDTAATGTDIYCPKLSEKAQTPGLKDDNFKVGQTLCGLIEYWNKDDPNQASNERTPSGNAFTDAMQLIFGVQGLFEIRNENAAVHPMAQLSGLGKGLVDSAVINIGGSTIFAFGGGVASALGSQRTQSGIEIAISAINSIAFLGLTAGVILYYILPFMPFIYFFFALGSWLKTIFEAMVGVPLWALAHLRLDGEGLPGDAGINGYYLIFEIFVRPILTVFGLIAAMVIFTAQIRTLNFIWDLVTDNVSGFQGDPTSDYGGQIFDRGIIDKFFFTIIYTVICYMLATASFKLIDKIPDNILRWMGGSVSAFSDGEQDQIDQINRYAAFSGISVGREAITGIQQGARGLGQGVGGLLNQVQTIGRSGGPAPGTGGGGPAPGGGGAG